jgi:hypothetical protein
MSQLSPDQMGLSPSNRNESGENGRYERTRTRSLDTSTWLRATEHLVILAYVPDSPQPKSLVMSWTDHNLSVMPAAIAEA